MTTRILNVVNFSNGTNPQADSGLRFQIELLRAILKKRDDFCFYLLAPTKACEILIREIHHENIHVIATNFVSRQRGGTFHFDTNELSRLIDLKRVDIDVLWINQPELTSAFLDYFNKVHFLDVRAFSYVHWMDWKKINPEKNRWNTPGNLSLLAGLHVSQAVGCNSDFGQQKILSEASRFLKDDLVDQIKNKLVPLEPGIDRRAILKWRSNRKSKKKTIIFPFRTQSYTGFKSLVEVHLAQLWTKRKDFRLVVTNPNRNSTIERYSKKYPFISTGCFTRAEYVKALWEADIVIGCHNGTNQWSMAAVEALAAECVPLFNEKSFFPEMLYKALPLRKHELIADRFLYYRVSLRPKLEFLLDNLEANRKLMMELGRRIRVFYDWDAMAYDWIAQLEATDSSTPIVSRSSQAYKKIRKLVSSRSGQGCTKEEILRYLKWHPASRHISWTKYRNRLRKEFTDDPKSQGTCFRKH